MAAYYTKLKVGHVESGLRTSDKYAPWLEEMNRWLTVVVADLHFAPTEHSMNLTDLDLSNLDDAVQNADVVCMFVKHREFIKAADSSRAHATRIDVIGLLA